MKKILLTPKFIMLTAAFMLAITFTHAQDKTKRIGHRPKSGSANSSFDVVKGHQVGIKINAGHKPVQLLQLNFDAESEGSDSVKFKVNVYRFDDVTPGENLVKQVVTGALTRGKNRVSVDLSPYNIIAKGRILVAIEWIKNGPADNRFAIGLFNGGTYHYEDGVWKKVPIAGVDFNLLVRKV